MWPRPALREVWEEGAMCVCVGGLWEAEQAGPMDEDTGH